MKKGLLKGLTALACFLFTACAVITVNVYFPEKAAKEAYKSLDDMLLKNAGKAPAEETPVSAPIPPEGAPSVAPLPEAAPHSSLFHELPSVFAPASAYAAQPEADADALAVELAGMPEVLKAYDEMSRRLPRLNTLFASGAVGLTNQGLVTVRDKAKVTSQDQPMLTAENQSRKTVVTAMAKAILKLGKQKESKAALDQVLPKAAATFAETKRDAAQPGWWIQMQNGNWVQK
jgi:uncharacterized protein